MRISAKSDYAVRALLELAVTPAGTTRSARDLAEALGIPQNFLENILSELRRAGLVQRIASRCCATAGRPSTCASTSRVRATAATRSSRGCGGCSSPSSASTTSSRRPERFALIGR